jgi:hypothetical protein
MTLALAPPCSGPFSEPMAAAMALYVVRAGGGYAAAGEGGVVAAAVVGVQHQHHVQNVGLLLGVALVLPHHAQEVFSQGKAGLGIVDIQRMAQQIVAHDGVGVGHDEGHARHDLHRLAQHVGGGGVVRAGVVGIQRQHAAGELVHKIVGRSLENDVLYKPVGQGAGLVQHLTETLELSAVGQRAHEQQIHGLLIAEGALPEMRLGNVRGADAAVIEPAGHGYALTVYDGVALDAADLRDADYDAGAVGIAQAALDVHLGVLIVADGVGRPDIGVESLEVPQQVCAG